MQYRLTRALSPANARIVRTVVVLLLAVSSLVSAQGTGVRRAPGAGHASEGMADGKPGFVLGVHTIAAPGVSISGPDLDGTFSTQLGVGAGLMVGYVLNRTYTLTATFDLAKQQTTPDSYPSGSFGLTHFELGARANLPMGNAKVVPYASAAIGRRALSATVVDEFGESYPSSLSGGVLSLGGGFQHHLSPKMAWDAGVSLAFGKFDHFQSDTDNEVVLANGSTSIRLRVGMTWRP